MPLKITSVTSLIELLSSRPERLIAIDGALGSGKSTLGKRVAHDTGWPLVCCDDHLESDKGTYLGALRYGDIDQVLRAHLADPGKVIIEGVCIREVLEHLTSRGSSLLTLYVQRLSTRGEWSQEEELMAPSPSLRAAVAAMSRTAYETPVARREVRSYHAKCQPHLTSDILYQWTEGDVVGA